jgi:hypothetical protein
MFTPKYIEEGRAIAKSRCLVAGPKSHLASIGSVKIITLDAGRCLAGGRNAICGRFHELGEVVHRRSPKL